MWVHPAQTPAPATGQQLLLLTPGVPPRLPPATPWPLPALSGKGQALSEHTRHRDEACASPFRGTRLDPSGQPSSFRGAEQSPGDRLRGFLPGRCGPSGCFGRRPARLRPGRPRRGVQVRSLGGPCLAGTAFCSFKSVFQIALSLSKVAERLRGLSGRGVTRNGHRFRTPCFRLSFQTRGQRPDAELGRTQGPGARCLHGQARPREACGSLAGRGGGLAETPSGDRAVSAPHLYVCPSPHSWLLRTGPCLRDWACTEVIKAR